MCRNCVKESCPDRGSCCLETGTYLMNYAGCCQCNKKTDINNIDKKSENDVDGNETVTYKHVCQTCDHVIARHEYTFSVDDEFQEYTMNCVLCGYGEATVSILPDDPRQQRLF
ncbi:protein Churchill-like [Corticium candelabrum]|uniref:protein Churchill-like n=1 Tax=Corticium candelabrum TaxID=121492 RepID=UPI002E26DF2B|nr:protein Churchill-like [Corticium candelabrum]